MIAGMTTGSEDEQHARTPGGPRTRPGPGAGQKVQVALVPLWVALAVFWVLDEDADPWLRWAWAAFAALHVGRGVTIWRQLRRPAPASPGRRKAPGR